jgi:excisionase family DNA binding protein
MSRQLTAAEVAEWLKLSRGRIYELARQNLIPSYRLGRQVRFCEEDVRAFIARGGQPLPVQRGERHLPGRLRPLN